MLELTVEREILFERDVAVISFKVRDHALGKIDLLPARGRGLSEPEPREQVPGSSFVHTTRARGAAAPPPSKPLRNAAAAAPVPEGER